MFLHNLKYELLAQLRVRMFIVWLLVFPIALGFFFKMAFSGIYEKQDKFSSVPAAVVLTEEEQVRRYKEMSSYYGQDFPFPSRYTLILNRRSPAVQKLEKMPDGETRDLLAKQLYDIARLSSRPLESEDLKAFIARSNKLVEMLAQENGDAENK